MGAPNTTQSLKKQDLCAKFQYHCRSGECVHATDRCDGVKNCQDNSDEEKCTQEVCKSSNRFTCRNSQCIEKAWRCNGRHDCDDRSDELDCPPSNCESTQFRCGDGSCQSLEYVCDGDVDCPDGSDEAWCKKISCSNDYFSCGDRCIENRLVCSGVIDCVGGEDEEHCRDCDTSTSFQCGDYNRTCIPLEKLCDDRKDCEDGSDEGGKCAEECHIHCNCYRSPLGPKCRCSAGYILEENKCKDINECKETSLVCDHICQNFYGGYSCRCVSGYQLQKDNASCRIEDAARALLLFGVDHDVRAYYLDHSEYFVVHTDASNQVFGVSYDPVKGEVYWSNVEGVFKKDLRSPFGSSPVVSKKDGVGLIEDLAVDWFGRNVYLSDSRLKRILVCSLGATGCLSLVEDTLHPRALNVEFKERYLYYTDVLKSVIVKVGLDGSSQRILVEDRIKWPNALALDPPARRLYWFDAMHKVAESVNYNGEDRRRLLYASVHHPFSMALWEERLYWSDWTHKKIYSCLKRDGRLGLNLIKDSTEKFYGLSVYHESMFANVSNPCASSPCQYLCLLSPLEPSGYKCACPNGYQLIGHQCTVTAYRGWLAGTGSQLLEVKRPITSQSIVEEIEHPVPLKDLSSISYDPTTGDVFLGDLREKSIYKCSLNSSLPSVTVIHKNSTHPTTISIDWIRRNLYWVDTTKAVVEVSTITGRYTTVILDSSTLSKPIGLDIDPMNRYMFVSDYGVPPFIMRCDLTGNRCIKIVVSALEKPSSVAVDTVYTKKKLYWCDSRPGVIEVSDYDGKQRETLYKDLKYPVSVGVSKDHIAWSQFDVFAAFFGAKKNGAVTDVPIDVDIADRIILKDISLEVKGSQYNTSCLTGTCEELCIEDLGGNPVCLCGGGKASIPGLSCTKAGCLPHEFRCDSGRCIPKSWRCDRNPDCTDESDEKYCIGGCGNDSFVCSKAKSCIHMNFVCDGIRDCPDGEDEMQNCTCKFGKWKCQSGECIPAVWQCNQQRDCRDGSDEADCSCSDSHRHCNDGSCRPLTWFCDGDEDCPDGSDELHCGPANCTSNSHVRKFFCDGKCSRARLCDGIKDCADGSDEKDPSCQLKEAAVPCEAGFLCSRTSTGPPMCLPLSAKCNGTYECPNKEDELTCLHPCPEEFMCSANRRCIPRNWMCDGHFDCPDGEDEQVCFFQNRTTQSPTTSWKRLAITESKNATNATTGLPRKDPAPLSTLGIYAVNTVFLFLLSNLQTKMYGSLPRNSRVKDVTYSPMDDSCYYLDGVHGVVGYFKDHKDTILFSGMTAAVSFDVDFLGRNLYISTVEELAVATSETPTIVSSLKVCSVDTRKCGTLYREHQSTIRAVRVSSSHRKVFLCINGGSAKTGKLVRGDASFSDVARVAELGICGGLALDEEKLLAYVLDLSGRSISVLAWSGKEEGQIAMKVSEPLGLGVAGPYVIYYDANYVFLTKYVSGSVVSTEHHVAKISAFREVQNASLITHLKCTRNCSAVCITSDSNSMCLCEDSHRADNCSNVQNCPPNYCFADGLCLKTFTGETVCVCPASRKGVLCEIEVDLVVHNHGTSVVVIVIIFIILVVIAVLLIVFLRKKKVIKSSPNNYFRFANPAFGLRRRTTSQTAADQSRNASSHNPAVHRNHSSPGSYVCEAEMLNQSG